MNILVTGGLGTVGHILVGELRKRGNFVVSVDRLHAVDELSFSLGSDLEKPQYACADIGKFRQIERVFKKLGPFDYVYNCAAEFGRWNGEDFYEDLWQTNVVGLKNLICLQEKLGFRLIHFSSSEVYGDWQGVMFENVMDKYPIKQMNDYAMTKWVNEMQIHNSFIKSRTETVIVRLFNTYGPGEYYSPYRSVNCRFLYCALNNLPWTVFKGHSRTSSYLVDIVRTLCNIVDNYKPGEVYNLGGNQLHTIEELSNVILEATGADPSLVHYKDSEILTTKSKRVDVSKSVRDLDHKSTYSLKEGIRLTAQWMCKVYGIDKEIK